MLITIIKQINGTLFGFMWVSINVDKESTKRPSLPAGGWQSSDQQQHQRRLE